MEREEVLQLCLKVREAIGPCDLRADDVKPLQCIRIPIGSYVTQYVLRVYTHTKSLHF